MKLATTIVTRTEWSADKVELHDLGEIPVHQLSMHLARLINEDILVVQIQLWNQDKLSKIQAEQSK